MKIVARGVPTSLHSAIWQEGNLNVLNIYDRGVKLVTLKIEDGQFKIECNGDLTMAKSAERFLEICNQLLKEQRCP